MHPSAYRNCEAFRDKYCKGFDRSSLVVDFGSLDVNGTLKPIFSDFNYEGIDIVEGPNVNMVYKEDAPFANREVDIVVCSSSFEHDEFFWLTFLEMCRIIRIGGLIYINAPSAGTYHPFPIDAWRFNKDSWVSLSKWAIRNGFNIELLESYIDSTLDDIWKNSIGIFKKLS